MKRIEFWRFALGLVSMLGVLSLSAQPQAGDVFREYVWIPDMVNDAGKFLRVGGNLDYAHSETHLDQDLHENGYLPISDSLDLEHATKAEVVLELVQSHVDTKGLAISMNEEPFIAVADLPFIPKPQSNYMLHAYPRADIPLDQLKAGYGNTFALRVDSVQKWKWPQNIFYGLIFRIYYEPSLKNTVEATLGGISEGESIFMKQPLSIQTKTPEEIRTVDYLGLYEDINWEGDGVYRQWHGHFHRGKLTNHIGSSSEAPFSYNWNTSWLPDQYSPLSITAKVTEKTGLIHLTEAVGNLSLERDFSVELVKPYHQPENWVTREDNFEAKLAIHGEVSQAEAYQLSWRSWSPCYARGVYLNGTEVFSQSPPCYDVKDHMIHREDVSLLLHGENTITTGKMPLVDGQMVHGMEVQYPGIMMKVKYASSPSTGVKITEGSYEERDHFIVSTPAAIYYYDKAGGGLSRLLDKDGRDWIDFKMKPWGEYPSAAASAFRGIPNSVFQSEDGGAGHPGHDLCTSVQVDDHTIRSTSKSGKWSWEWSFQEEYAELQILTTDPDHAYWFLYEGTPGGMFDPENSYFGYDKGGPLATQWDYYKGEKLFDQISWAYVGHKLVERVLLLSQLAPDTLSDTFSYLGNTKEGIDSNDGMVVFGFGRAEGAKPLLTQPLRFRVQFIEKAIRTEEDHAEITALFE